MPSAVVVGGGISGVACAVQLSQAGIDVRLRERAHALGGRLATRTLRDTGTAFDGRVVDIGASYFTVTDTEFGAVVEALEDMDVARRWTSAFHVSGPSGMQGVTVGPVRYAAPAGLRSVVQALAARAPVTVETASPVRLVSTAGRHVTVDDEAVDAAALCLPHPQATRIATDLPDSPIPWEPVLAVTCVFAERSWKQIDGVFVNDDPVLTWIADDGSRRGDEAPVLVAHVHPVLSARHLDDPETVIPLAVAAIQRVLDVADYPDWVDVHRWSFAKPLAGREESYWLHGTANLGAAGDAWAGGPRVEAAWLSGHRLGQALAARIG